VKLALIMSRLFLKITRLKSSTAINNQRQTKMASSSKSKGSVRTVEWWKHLRDRKRAQNKLVRRDGKKQIAEQKK
jgi:hypothetical protein